MTTCPCCGQELQGRLEPAVVIASLRLPVMVRRVAEILVRRFGRDVHTSALIETCYFDKPDDEPDDALGCVRQRAYNLRLALRPYGLTVSARTQGRGGDGLYRMHWLDEPAWMPVHKMRAAA